MQTVRKELHDHLCRINPDKNWDFIINQVRRRLLCSTVCQQLLHALHRGHRVEARDAGRLCAQLRLGHTTTSLVFLGYC